MSYIYTQQIPHINMIQIHTSPFPSFQQIKPQSDTPTTLPETNISHLKIDNWNMILSFWGVSAYFQGAMFR